jgi:hypothetical protein
MKKLIHKFDITPDDLGLQLNINTCKTLVRMAFDLTEIS